MPGFNIAVGKHEFPVRYIDDCGLSCNTILNDEFTVQKFTLKKFEDDKLFIDREDYTLVLEGVILNKKEIQKPKLSWEETVISLYREKGESFYSQFRGSFSGALYDKNVKKWIIFTDHIGSKHIYYSKRGEQVYLSSEIADLYELFRDSGLDYSLDEQSAYMLLSYGYMLEDFTLCSEIKKLRSGSYIKIEEGSFSIERYYRLPEIYDQTISEDEAIERVDELFRNAISLQFEKDKEYGYKHLVALSGGLDSRMTSWVAHDMGYTDQLNFTFSQSGYLDETIAKEIASDLKHEWIFKALDNGLLLKNIEEIINYSGGNILSYSLSHGHFGLKDLNLKNYGILHSGLLGDVLKGDYINKNGRGEFSKKYLSRVKFNITYNNKEQFITNQRAFNGIHHSLVMTNHFTEGMSPFYDINFLSYSITLSPKIRDNRNIYKKWILKKYPKAADYVWESTKSKITAPHLKVLGKDIPIKQIPQKVLTKLGLIKPPSTTAFHMNPLSYWYKTNPVLKEFQDNYFKNNIERLSNYSVLKKDSIDLYRTGNGVEKNQVLTLLSALKESVK